MAEKEMKGSSKSLKRKIEEVEDEACDRHSLGIKKFLGAPKEAVDSTSTDVSMCHGASNLPPTWKWKGTLLYYASQEIQPSQQIAAFDFDRTLAKTSLFKHGPDAWSILYPSCVQKLTQLHRDGYKLVIFTNQAAIGKAKASKQKVINEKKGRLIGFVRKVGLPFQIFVATSKDSYRKPNTGMWDFLCQSCNGDMEVDKSKSFFVGDAAGRKKDHGASDKEFATNCGLTFYTEDEFFLKDVLKSKETNE